MATEWHPSSYRCDCGFELHFTENFVRDMRRMSERKRQRASDGDHAVVFYEGEAKEIICPKLKKCPITDFE